MEAQSITNQEHIQKVLVYPNPFTTRISLEITSLENETAIVCMLNHEEKIVKMFSWYLKSGTNKMSLDGLDNIPVGSYTLTIRNTGGDLLSDAKMIKE